MDVKLPQQAGAPISTDPRTVWTIFATLLFSTFITIEAAAFQSPAMPIVTRHFGIPVTDAALITTLYFLASITFAPIMGRLGDRIGRKKMILIGLFVFSSSEFLAAFSPSFTIFLAARFLQGLGVACIAPIVFTYIGVLFPNRQRGLALGIFGFTMACGGVVGGTIAGFLIGKLGWPSIYWLSGLLGAIGFITVVFLVPASAPNDSSRDPFDLKGAALLFLAMGGLLFAPTWASTHGILSPGALAAIATAVVATVALWFVEQRVTTAPVVDVSLLKLRSFSLPAMVFIGYNMSYAAMLYTLAFFVIERPGGSPAQYGIVTMFMYGGMMGQLIGGKLADTIDPRTMVLASLAIGFCVMLTLSTFNNSTPLWVICANALAMGIGTSLKAPAGMKLGLNAIPEHKMGAGSGLFSMLRDLGIPAGSAFGLAIFGATVGATTKSAATAAAREAGMSADGLAGLATAVSSQGKTLSQPLSAELQRLGLSIGDLLRPAKEQALSSSLSDISFILAGLMGTCFLLALLLPRTPAALERGKRAASLASAD